jgi:hypothetical protein
MLLRLTEYFNEHQWITTPKAEAMRVDRTWTISFEDHERNRLNAEIKYIELPSDMGWRPMLPQIATTCQVTLPLRAVERLALELDMVRAKLVERSSRQEFQKKFPMIAALFEEVNAIPQYSKRRSA